MVDAEAPSKLLERGVVEVAPLAFMRGRTLNDSFIILDEAQNTTPEQMKMFLTRIGFGSKAVVTGDTTQVDVPGRPQRARSGLERVLTGIDGLASCTSTAATWCATASCRTSSTPTADPMRDETGDMVDPADPPGAPVVAVDIALDPDDVEADVDIDRWQRLAAAALATEGVERGELNLVFVDEPAMTALNIEHMDGDGPTDVLAFPIDGRPEPGPGDGAPIMLGDVVVCPAVARRQAAEHGVGFDDEIALLVVHGILHVLGHDHAEADETALMQGREQALLGAHHRP
jgi:probable rRNA maturation factor